MAGSSRREGVQSLGVADSRAATDTLSSVIISLTPPTASEFKRLYDETGWGRRALEDFEIALAGTWITCVVRDDAGALVGMGRLISDGALHAFVTEMIVIDSARGRGIGGSILDRLVAEASARGVHDVQLFAARDRASFYERNGFDRRPDDAPGMQLRTPLDESP